jgi:hypothetical protein
MGDNYFMNALSSMFSKKDKEQELMQMPEASFGVANNLDASMSEGVAGNVPVSPMQQQAQGQLAPAGTDWKGMAKDLAKGLKSTDLASGGIMSQKDIPNIGLMQTPQAPQMQPQMGMAANQGMGQPQGMSAAMQAISGGIGNQPGMLEMLKRMRR